MKLASIEGLAKFRMISGSCPSTDILVGSTLFKINVDKNWLCFNQGVGPSDD